VSHGLKRIVVIGSDGFATFDAIRWITDVDASIVFLDSKGKLLFVSGPTAPFEARLRRAQSLALSNGTALKISTGLIARKLDGQATVARDMLRDPTTAEGILRFRDEVPSAHEISSVRVLESQAANLYWSAWYDVPIRWPRNDEREVPDLWKRFGTRISPLTGSPRLAVTPPGAILNLLYGLLESESRLACVAMGLDPAIGVMHVDQSARDSLSLDILEPCRPKCDAFLLHWLQTEPFRRADFFEMPNGNARIMSALAVKLCQTADTWRKFMAPVAEYVAMELAASASKSPTLTKQLFATRLTQSRKREVKGSNVPVTILPKNQEHFCKGCGKQICPESEQCAECSLPASLKTLDSGRKKSHSADAIARRSQTNRMQALLIRDWNPSELPAWLTRDVYISKVLPALTHVTKARIRAALNVSYPHSAYIQNGKRIPHARHWEKLAQLVGLSANS